ncbi:MAG: hypothetical protein ACK4JY_08300 [Brevundimonas sp.]|uniref:hypothetical protein n=1 Tax=Brevundimonas sp. TaxID=1871086 RepID=UPI0039196F67
MGGLAWEWPMGGERWRKPAIVAASLALHAVVLGNMAFDTFEGSRRSGRIIDYFPGPVIHVQIEPRLLRRGETARTRAAPAPDSPVARLADPGSRRAATTGSAGSAPPGQPTALSPGDVVPAPSPPTDVVAEAWRVRPDAMGDRMGRGLRASALACARPALLGEEERARCDRRMAARVAAIPGTGDRARDARLARQGARALARYEARRAPLSGADDPPCDKTGPIAECEMEIHVDLFSSIDGWLPNLRGDDE